ncbi:cation:dicarboxylate symporter family transporter [uncultured Corynebacterium sp.]|uniref:cation:dicarboxylate symporter family transporter n=1 Tax=uncultured Corynebacterium sp. TaxID=159447 RepID=UPI0025D23546|nr:cation:dicarboxylase symporter family transporter [uncultured Corynebacterium sp.]
MSSQESPAQGGGATTPAATLANKKKTNKSHWLYITVIIAIVAGVILGLVSPTAGENVKFLGTMFVNLIKMMIAPIIFCTIVVGVGHVREAATVGKAGGLSLVYFIIMSTFALAIGLIVGNLIEPGSGLTITPGDSDKYPADEQKSEGVQGIIEEIVPDTIVSSMTSGEILQALFIALMVGFAVQAMPNKVAGPVLYSVELVQQVVFKVMSMVLWVAPVGAFGAMAGVVAGNGLSAVGSLLKLMLAFWITCILFIAIVLGVMLRTVTGLNILKLLRYLGSEYLLIFGTSSSESALPQLIDKMNFAGVDKSTVGIVVPTGYSFNLDGTAIYLTMSSLFIAEAMDMPMSLGEQVGLMVIMIIASKGAAGVSGAGIATLAAGLQAHEPQMLSGVDTILGIDKFMSEARSLTNFTGNAVATLLVGKWTKSIDLQRVRDVLDRKVQYEVGSVADTTSTPEFVGATPQPAVQEPQTEIWKP